MLENVALHLVPVQQVNLVSTVSQQAVTVSSGFPVQCHPLIGDLAGGGGAQWGGGGAYSSPKVLVSSTAVSIFSNSMEKDGYGGRSRRLKQVWALQ